MTNEVKSEQHGSRPSKLVHILDDLRVPYEKDIFFISARGEFNKDKHSRYSMVKELHGMDELAEYDLSTLRNVIQPDKMARLYGIYVNESGGRVHLKGWGWTREYSIDEYVDRLMKSLGCGYVDGSARGSARGTAFSRLLREHAGKSISATDIDFFIPKMNMFIEEKNITVSQNGKMIGALGKGQYYSYRELMRDFMNRDMRLSLLSKGRNGDWCVSDLPEFMFITSIPSWGEMVKVPTESTMNDAELSNWIGNMMNQSSECAGAMGMI